MDACNAVDATDASDANDAHDALDVADAIDAHDALDAADANDGLDVIDDNNNGAISNEQTQSSISHPLLTPPTATMGAVGDLISGQSGQSG